MTTKNHLIIDPETLPLAANRWDVVLIGLLGGMLLFMPAAFGAVEAWSELVTLVFAAALSFYLVARIAFDPEFRFAWTWLYLPIVLFLLLVALQLAPLPSSLVRSLAPTSLATREGLLGETFAPSELTALSFYPLATAEHLRIALIGAVVFVTVASVFRRTQHIKLLLAVIFLIGCAEAALALLQILTRSESIYWIIPVAKGRVTTSGTFVNYSNFSQFMNLSLGAGLALLLIRIEDQRRNEMQGAGWGWIARTYWEKNAWLCAGIILCALSVFASMSRNGAISLILAAAVVGAALFQRRSLSWRGWLIGVLPAGVLAALLIFGFDIVYARLATLHESESYNLRWEMTRAAVQAWQRYPVWGTGLGTHEVVFPMFEKSVIASVAGHADNDYAQLLEETGLVGVFLVGAFVVMAAVVAGKIAVRGRRPIALGIYGIMFGLVAIAIHSATDFGQRLPANLSLSAALCGLVVAISRLETRSRKSPNESLHTIRNRTAATRWIVAVFALMGLTGVWLWVIRDAYAAHIGERWWTAAATMESRIRAKPAEATVDDYSDLIAAAEAAFQHEPKNVNYGYWLNNYRWQSISHAVDPDTAQIVLHPGTIPFVSQIADELAAVRRICPTYGPPYALEGELRLFVLNESRGAELIRKGVRLAPYDAPTCLVAGELAARQGNLEDAHRLLTRAIALQPGYFREVADLYVKELKRLDLARALAKTDYNRLRELADLVAQMPEFAADVPNLRNEAEAALRLRVEEGRATAQELAALASVDLERGNAESAIKFYRSALAQDYQQVEWRLSLATALAKTEQIDEAIHEVKIALRLRPRHGGATKLLEQLTTRSENARSNDKR